MKKIVASFSLFFLIILAGNAQGFYQLSFKTLNGDSVQLSSYAGKKVLFIIAPLSQNDSVYNQLISFKNRYGDTVKIIAVLSVEDGYQAANASAIQSLYSGTGIELTEAMYTKKTSGSAQSILMRWLTDKNHNNHFDMDAKGIGHKFFVSETGREFAVMPPQTALNAPVIDRIVHSGN